MALPLAPVAVVAMKYGAIALAGYMIARRVQRGALDQSAEDALDRVPEGVTAHRPRDRDQGNATLRFRRVVRLGVDGPGVEIDLTALGRLRLRRA